MNPTIEKKLEEALKSTIISFEIEGITFTEEQIERIKNRLLAKLTDPKE